MAMNERMVEFGKAARSAAATLAGRIRGALKGPRVRRVGARLLILVFAVYVASNAVARIREGQVAVFVNNLTGSVYVNERVGYHLFVPWMTTMYKLDRRVQSLLMSESAMDGSRGGQAVKLKTSDGSNVSIDVQVSFRIIAEQAETVIKNAGVDYAYRDLWVDSAVRAMTARELGKLTTEQIYDAGLRNERAHAMTEALNRDMSKYGIEIVAVMPQELRFYKEYEEVIKSKKLADQEVEEQQAKARLATEDQKKKVSEAQFAATAKIASAEGDAMRILAEAEGYVARTRINAEASLTVAESKAEGMLATGLAEAEGLRLSADAVSGSGGVNLVALEYAKQLGNIQFSGVPVVQDGRMGQYRIHSGASGGGCADGTCAAR